MLLLIYFVSSLRIILLVMKKVDLNLLYKLSRLGQSPGTEHSPEQSSSIDFEIDHMLMKPNLHAPLIEGEKQFFEATVTDTNRVATGLAPSEKVLQDNTWYCQHSAVTCMPWALYNASLAICSVIPTHTMKELLVHARDEQKQRGQGASFSSCKDILNKHASKIVCAEELPLDALRKTTTYDHQTSSKAMSMRITLAGSSTEEIIDASESKHAEENSNKEITESNAATVKQLIDSDKAIIVGVIRNSYYKSKHEKDALHALSVVGYRVNDKGNMDVRIIDPAIGTAWVSLEHLSSSLWQFGNGTLSKVYDSYLSKL